MKGVRCVNCVFVCRRKRDGKYFRGARWWKWTRTWRTAALFNMDWWDFVLRQPNMPDMDEIELVNLNEVLDREWQR